MKNLTLIDFKTSKAIYDEYRIQVAAYVSAYNLYALTKVTKMGILRLDKETGMPFYEDCTEGWEKRSEAFDCLREYYEIEIEPFLSKKEKERFYRIDKDLVPSVTTILGCLSKPALIQWSANCAVESIERNISEIRAEATTQERIEQILKSAKTAYRKESKKAMDIGSIVHEAIETYLKGGKPEEIIGDNEKAESSFLAFLEWKDKTKLEIVEIEQPVLHRIRRYGGTPDIVAYMED